MRKHLVTLTALCLAAAGANARGVRMERKAQVSTLLRLVFATAFAVLSMLQAQAQA